MILCCGEALIDMLPRTGPTGDRVFAPHAGGAVFNTAIALARLEAPASLFTGLSTDLFGRQLEAALAGSGVDTRHAVRADRPTTLAFVELSDGHARYAFYDENTAGRMLTEADLPDLAPDVAAAFFGGISLAVEPCADAYAELMARAARDRVTMLDPNIRPGFIRDEAAFRARLDAMIARADILKVSDEDLRWLAGDGAVADLARGMLARGPRLVCVTEGAQGARAVSATQDVFVAATPVTPVDTVGAGDTFNAGLLAALHEEGALRKGAVCDLGGDILRAALGLATRAAAVTVSRPGADPPRRADLGL